MGIFYRFLFLSIFFTTFSSWSATTLPKNLSQSDRIRALEILGFGSAPKILDNPYPLGGYKGVEVGLSSEFIPIDELARLGSKTTDRGELNYYTLSFGKGIYYNVDTYVYFTPFLQNESVQTYGGQLRWGFYEAAFFPLSLSGNFYTGGANFSNLINVTTVGVDLIATVSMDNVAIFIGTGRIRASGKFIGGADGITSSQTTESHDINDTHTVFGLNVNFTKAFMAFEIDRCTDSNYSGKLGYRF
ncbi:MAG: hypothetical protein ACXVCY_15175 [Pseudobdellovibrionaceae bacterium]